ncbi:MAG: PQQ-binding-like beta-propeller repeat protein [Dehalococcoidia bacterium]|nr:PQQ-binding-like beta-propeller repeat protein [Dehalococcoidia bacterium]
MIVGRMVKSARTLLLLIAVAVTCSLALGMNVLPAPDPGIPYALDAESASDPSVTCMPLGLYGDITTPPLMGKLSDSSNNLTFVGTTNGLYAVAPGGKLHHFIYSPFGIKHMALIDDVTGDGTREIVIALDDTQVPALRCYDGATWEKLWQFAPTARIWDNQWLECQLFITSLKVIGNSDAQSLLITSGRCVLSVDTKDGSEQWRFTGSAALPRMVTLADLNDDAADEVFAGSSDGYLYWLNARTGKQQWRTKLPEHKDANYGEDPWYSSRNYSVSDIIVLDEDAGKIAVASADDWVHMYDLREKKRVWGALAFLTDPGEAGMSSDCVLMSPTADFTGDGAAEILLAKTRNSVRYAGGMTNGKRALCDSAGNIVWRQGTSNKSAYVWHGMAFETAVFEGKPVYLDRSESEPWEIRLVDLKDGESVLHAVPMDATGGMGVFVRQPGGDGYLSFSSNNDLVAMSANGDLLWHYPRVGNVATQCGNFVGDVTEDVLLWAESGGELYPNFGARLLRMIDGATKDVAWSYEMPYSVLKGGGGLKRVQVTADLVGSDNVPDIIACAGEAIFIFSGKDGTVSNIPVGQPIASVEIIRNGPSGNALAVGIANGLLIIDIAGTPLWATTASDWMDDESGSFMTLDDINSDNVTDLAVWSTNQIVALKSQGNAADFELHHTIQCEDGFSIRVPEVVADSDGDGIRELACLQEGAPQTQEHDRGHSHSPPRHLLCIESLEDRQILLKADLQGTVLGYDLACGDFNADGYPDSAMLVLEWSDISGGRSCLRILSDKDGSQVWEHATGTGGFSYGSTSEGIMFSILPIVNIGDINGDSADDLAYSAALPQPSGSYQQQRLQVFDVAHDTMLRDIAVTPRLHQSSFGNYDAASQDDQMLLADFNADGYPEIVMRVTEPSMPSYDPDVGTFYYDPRSSSPQYLALIDVENGQRVATFARFRANAMSLLRSHQSGVLEVAACGGICYLQTGLDLQITSPGDGERTRSIVTVKWEGPSDGSFSQVFVDGVRNDITNGLESDLFLARGNHTILVRSIDECGRISYSPPDLSTPLSIRVSPSPWKPVWLAGSLLVLLAAVLALFYARLHRAWRARRRATK